jgi:hypothetical protein
MSLLVVAVYPRVIGVCVGDCTNETVSSCFSTNGELAAVDERVFAFDAVFVVDFPVFWVRLNVFASSDASSHSCSPDW